MGQVHAQMAPPPITDDVYDPVEPATEPNKKDFKLPLRANPGTVEELYKQVKDVQPACFEGIRFGGSKGLTETFQVSHAINLGSSGGQGYKFGATYIGRIVENEPRLVISTETDPSGDMTGTLIWWPAQNIKTKTAVQYVDNKCVGGQIGADYIGTNFTATANIGQMDFKKKSALVVGQCLVNVAPRLALGIENVVQWSPHIPGGYGSIFSVLGRYTADNYILSGSLGTAALHIAYYRRQNTTTQVGVELETNFMNAESVSTFAYQVDLPKADLTFRGSIDSNWTVGGVLERRLAPFPFTLTLSAMLNHTSGASRVGIGFLVG